MGCAMAEARHHRAQVDSRPVSVRFVVDKVALWQVSPPVLQFALSVSFHMSCITDAM